MLPNEDRSFYNRYGKFLYPVFPGLFFILIFLNNYSWLLKDKSLPISDSPMHLEMGRRYFHFVANGNIEAIFHYTNEYYPNLTYLLTVIFQRIFGFNDDMASLSQFPFWLILIYSTYFIGLKLFGEKAGVLAFIASFSSPFLLRTSQSYLLDIPSAAMTAFSLACLFYCETFRKPGRTLLFFIGFAAAMLCKWSSAFFIVIPFVLCFYIFLKRLITEKLLSPSFIVPLIISVSLAGGLLAWNYFHIHRMQSEGISMISLYLTETGAFAILLAVVSFLRFRDESQKRFLQGVVLFFILIWHFYGLNIFNIVSFIKMQSQVAYDRGDVYSPVFLFVRDFIMVFTLPGILFLISGIVWFLLEKENSFDRKLFLWTLAGALIIIFLIPIKDPRYFLPLIPLTSVLQTFWILKIREKHLRIAVLCLLILISTVGIIGWRIPLLKRSMNQQIFNIIGNSFAVPPDEKDWKLEEIEKSIHRYSSGRNTVILALFESAGDMKGSPRDMAVRYNRFNPGVLIMPDTTGGMPGGRIRSFNEEEGSFYQFALTPPDGEASSSRYDNLLILYFRRNYAELEENTYLDYFLLERNFSGERVLREKIDLPDNITLFVLQMKLNPPYEEK